MIEREMDNRGSKSAISLIIIIINCTAVKEQRVDGSYINSILKCTLTNYDSNCQVKILSNQLQIPPFYETPLASSSLIQSYRPHSAGSKKLSFRFANRSFITTTRPCFPVQAPEILNGRGLDPWFVTGFADAEGSFIIHIRKLPRNTTGWRVEGRFKITLHKKDLALLKQLQKFFSGVRKIGKNGKDTLSLDIRSIEELYTAVLPLFDSYSLITQKKVDFELFKRVIGKIKNKEHLTDVGIQEIVNIKASMNRGLSDELKEAFPNTKNFQLSSLVTHNFIRNSAGCQSSYSLTLSEVPSPFWVSGFTSGEGSFRITLNTYSSSLGKLANLNFSISQYTKDESLMRSLVSYFGCGRYTARSNKPLGEYECTKLSDINEKIIPFFIKHPIVGIKSLDFTD